jgi:hypothetical protein
MGDGGSIHFDAGAATADAATAPDVAAGTDAVGQDAVVPASDASMAEDAMSTSTDAMNCGWSPFAPPCDAATQVAPDAAPPDVGGGLDAAMVATDAGPVTGCAGTAAMEMLYGNGIAALANNWADADMAVRVTCNGAPLANATVHWAVTEGHGYVALDAFNTPWVMLDVPTDMNGVSKVTFKYTNSMPQPLQSTEPGKVNASIGAQSIDFLVTAFNPGPSIPLYPTANLIWPDGAHDLGSGRAGTILSMPVRINVYNATGWDNGRPAPNVGVSLVNDQDPTMPPVAWCIGEGNTALTDATGSAVCNVQLGNMPISGRYLRVVVGGTRWWNAINVDITP